MSTLLDLLDLLDVWAAGVLIMTDRTTAPDRWVPHPDANPDTYAGVGLPFYGYCPCTEVEGGLEPTAIGRNPLSLGTKTFLLLFDDGISIVVNVNTSEQADGAELEALSNAVHDLAEAAR